MKYVVLLLITCTLSMLAAEPVTHDYLRPSEQNVIYGMDHGTALLLDVYKPAKPNGYGVVFVMGTGFTANGEYDDVPLKDLDVDLHVRGVFPNFMGERYQLFKPMYEAGFTIFSVNHRLAPKNQLPVQIRDVQRAVQFIRYHAADYGIDPEHIGGLGHSSGATMITFLGVLDDVADPDAFDPVNRMSSRLQAVVPMSGLHDTLAALRQSPTAAGLLGTVVGHVVLWQPEGHPIYQEYKDASTVSYVTADDAPMLVVHGMEDDVVNIKQSEALVKALEAAGVVHEFIALPHTTHGAILEPVDVPPCPYAAKWLEKTLIP
ncbi:alpha/beta hydrolase [Coraliomargarita parva]|uniref:alpha/beta hydrolase n=1 Tax=Coraliomargarita parva TaxID=3014050 RepID=UPI0022B41214|nr:alpha/beta hydrolase [Coraliomargarita parva]